MQYSLYKSLRFVALWAGLVTLLGACQSDPTQSFTLGRGPVPFDERRGPIRGTIYEIPVNADSTLRPAEGVQVLVQVSNTRFVTYTNAQGVYSLDNLPNGNHRLRVSKNGYTDWLSPVVSHQPPAQGVATCCQNGYLQRISPLEVRDLTLSHGRTFKNGNIIDYLIVETRTTQHPRPGTAILYMKRGGIPTLNDYEGVALVRSPRDSIVILQNGAGMGIPGQDVVPMNGTPNQFSPYRFAIGQTWNFVAHGYLYSSNANQLPSFSQGSVNVQSYFNAERNVVTVPSVNPQPSPSTTFRIP